ncbi:hypothetical protein [Paenibacillus crassostreae]|uniref:hypothetical protein n=1 Tax=Paenibacillus crassostreae TaxID=1763538 RepID=UPI000AC8BEB8
MISDPTVYENLKVAIENHLYDLDNLEGTILITHRRDRMEMSVMGREFALQCVLPEHRDITAEISLEALLQDLAAEILELPGEKPACTLRLRFYMQIQNVEIECRAINEILKQIWKSEIEASQTLSYKYGQEQPFHMNIIEVIFGRKINEEQMEDIPELIDHMIQTLQELKQLQLA